MSEEEPISVELVAGDPERSDSEEESGGYFSKRVNTQEIDSSPRKSTPIVERVPPEEQVSPRRYEKDLGTIEGNFLYHYRVLLAIICSIPPILNFVTKFTYFVLTFGLLVVYLFDFLNRKRYSFIAFIVTSTFVLSTFYFRIGTTYFQEVVFFDFFFAFNLFLLAFVICLYASMNFVWLQRKGSHICSTMERAVFAAIPFVTTPFIITTIIEMNGIDNSHYYLLLLQCIQYHNFGSKIRSSFKTTAVTLTRKEGKKYPVIPFKFVSVLQIILLLTLPSIYYFGLHVYRFRWNNMNYVTQIIILVCGGLFFLMLQPKKYLWCLPKLVVSIYKNRYIRLTLMTLTSAVVVFYLEHEVFFKRYPHLLILPPFISLILLNIALALMLILFIIILEVRLSMGRHKKKKRVLAPSKNFCVSLSIATICFIVTCLIFVVTGISLWGFPLLALSLAGLANFMMTSEWKHFHIFVVSSALTLLGWCYYHFGFLDYEMEFNLFPFAWTVNLRDVIELITLHYALCFYLIPTLKLKNIPPVVYGLIWVCQAVFMAAIEELFFDQSDHEELTTSPLYSSFLICCTTIGSLVMLYKAKDKFSFNTMNIMIAIIISKNVVLVDTPYQHRGKFFTVLPFIFFLTRGLMMFFRGMKLSSHVAALFVLLYCISTYMCKDVLWTPLFERQIQRPMGMEEFVRTMNANNPLLPRSVSGMTRIKYIRRKGVFTFLWFSIRHISSFVFSMDPKLFGLMVFIMGIGSIFFTHVSKDVGLKKLSFLLLLLGFLWGGFEPVFKFQSEHEEVHHHHGRRSLYQTLVPYILLSSVFIFMGYVFRLFYLPRSKYMKMVVFTVISLLIGVGVGEVFLPDCYFHVHILLPLSFWIVGVILCISHFDVDYEIFEEITKSTSEALSKKISLAKKKVSFHHQPSSKTAAVMGLSGYKTLPICLLLYFFYLVLCFVVYFTSTVGTDFHNKREDYYTIRYTIFGLLFLQNLFICVLLKFLLNKNPLMIDTSTAVKFRKSGGSLLSRTPNVTSRSSPNTSAESDVVDYTYENKEMFEIVFISTFICYFMGLFLAYVVFYHSPQQNELFLVMSGILFMLPNYRSPKNSLIMKSIVISFTVQLKCVILFFRELIDLVLLNWVFNVETENNIHFGIKVCTVSALFFIVFLGHIHFDIQLSNNMKKRPDWVVSIVFLLLSIGVWFVLGGISSTTLSSVRICAVVLMVEMLILLFIRAQWKKKKFISKNNIFVQ